MHDRRSRRLWTFAVLTLAFLATPGCYNLGREPGWGKPTTLIFELDTDVRIPERPVVIFICDGLSKPVFDEMLAAGELPHIKHYLVDRGVSIQSAVTSLPTVTYAEMTSYATGRYPGHHGILGNKWFDPRYLELQDYVTINTMSMVNDDIQAPTLYEMLDREDTVVVLTQINRGCSRFYENWMRIGVAWFFKMFRNVSLSTTARLQNTAWRANETGRWPDLVTLYYPSTDEVAHLRGHDSEQYREMVRVFDREVGDACKAFEQEGILDRMLLVMATDHGMAKVDEHCDVAKVLRDKGLKVWTKAINEQWGHYQKRYDKLKDYRAVVVVDSERFAKIHLHLPIRIPFASAKSTPPTHYYECDLADTSWSHRPSFWQMAASRPVDRPWAWFQWWSIVETLRALPGCQFLICGDRAADESHVYVVHSDRIGIITRRKTERGKVYSYRDDSLSNVVNALAATEGIEADFDTDEIHLWKPPDPLGYEKHPAAATLMDGAFHTADEWLAATIDTEYPDFVHQLSEMFDHERTGDLCLFAKPGWDFGKSNQSGHGGLTRDETVVPMIFAGAGLPRGATVPYARTVSLVPTVVEFIRGERDPALFHHFDGGSLLDILRAAGENAPSAASPAALPGDVAP